MAIGTGDRAVTVSAGTPDSRVAGPYAAVGSVVWDDRADVAGPAPIGTPSLLAGAASQTSTQQAVDLLTAALNETRADLRDIAAALRTSGVLTV